MYEVIPYNSLSIRRYTEFLNNGDKMLMKCNECGHDNQLGAIFCRECGTKLDVEKMRPKVEVKSEKDIAGIVKNVVAIVVLLSLLLTIVMMFYPQSGGSYVLEEDEQAKAEAKLNKLIKKIDGDKYSESKYVFTPEEATYLFNNKLSGLTTEEGTGYAIDKLYITLDSYDNVFLIAESKLFGSIPTSFSLNGYLEEDKPELTTTSVQMGHLSIPGFLQDKITTKFTPLIEGGLTAKIIAATIKIEVENGDFHITVKSMKKQK